MPYKDPAARRAFQRRNKARLRAGLPLKPRLTPEEIAERKRARWAAYAAKNPAAIRAKNERWNRLNADQKRDHNLRKRYGITLVEARGLLARQGGLCAICQRPISLEKPRGIHTDHDHRTGRLRGITHAGCNTAIGRLGDTPDGLLQAARYLMSAGEQPSELIDEHW